MCQGHQKNSKWLDWSKNLHCETFVHLCQVAEICHYNDFCVCYMLVLGVLIDTSVVQSMHKSAPILDSLDVLSMAHADDATLQSSLFHPVHSPLGKASSLTEVLHFSHSPTTDVCLCCWNSVSVESKCWMRATSHNMRMLIERKMYFASALELSGYLIRELMVAWLIIRCREGSAKVLNNLVDWWPLHQPPANALKEQQLCGPGLPRGFWVGSNIFVFLVSI